MVQYAVVDVETTGLDPSDGHKIVEFALVNVDADGNIESSWSTLVNPERRISNAKIHKIYTKDVKDAPTFADIAEYVANSLRGRIVVAHNLKFDMGFLTNEFGLRMRLQPFLRRPGMCTMELARAAYPKRRSRLQDVCKTTGVALGNHHSAEHDAYATAQILGHFINNEQRLIKKAQKGNKKLGGRNDQPKPGIPVPLLKPRNPPLQAVA